ncbi:Uncharacterised protein [uncultured archaeon]|nr:Uncharacterised protein [uncultured archaeon]
MKLKNYDYYLIILTALILFAIGLVCVYGITYYNYLAVNPQWTNTIQYSRYIEDMNSYLFPFLVLLLLALGLCIPKRLLEQDFLVKFTALSLGATLLLTFLSGIEKGLVFLLATMIIVQSFVLIKTIKRSNALRFEKEGYAGRLGSSLLHLGLVILIFNFMTLQASSFHLLIFWAGMIMITVGNIFSFYPEWINSLLK